VKGGDEEVNIFSVVIHQSSAPPPPPPPPLPLPPF